MDITRTGGVGAQMGLTVASDAATDAKLARAEREAQRVSSDKKELKKLAEDFESLFLNLVLKSMRDTVGKPGLINGGHAEEIYRSMLDDEYSKIMAAQRNTGLADNIEKFLLEAYDHEHATNSEAASEAQKGVSKAMGIKAYQALRPASEPATMGGGHEAD